MPIDREGDGPPLHKAKTKPDEAEGLRATPFTEDVFDDEYYRGRGRASGGSPIGLIVGVIFGAALAGGAAWYVLKGQGVGGINTVNGTPVIKADAAPYKIKPESPGGMQVENQDKTVYDRVAKSDAPKRVENLLPAAEQPKTPPKVEPKPEPKVAEPVAPVKSPLEEKRDELATMIAALEKKNSDNEKSPAIIEPASAPTKKAPTPITPPKTDPETPKAVEPKPTAAPPAAAAAPPAPVTPAPTVVASAPATASAPTGTGIQVQLAAAKSEEGAMAEWNRIKGKYANLVGALTPNVVRADLGERGVFFRLRAGMLPDKAAADALCASLTAEGNACIVVKQ